MLAFVRSLTILEKLLSAFLALGLDSLTFGALAGAAATVGFGDGIEALAVGFGVAIETGFDFGAAIGFTAGLTVLAFGFGAGVETGDFLVFGFTEPALLKKFCLTAPKSGFLVVVAGLDVAGLALPLPLILPKALPIFTTPLIIALSRECLEYFPGPELILA
jgi:hypothetical protein